MKRKQLLSQIDITIESVTWWRDQANETIAEGDKISSELQFFKESLNLPLLCPYCEKKVDKLEKRLKNIVERMDFLLAKGTVEADNLKQIRKETEKFYGNKS